MEEHADKVDPTTIEAIELAIAALKDDLEGDSASKIKSGIQNVTEAAMKLGEAIYKSSQEELERESAEPGRSGDESDDDIVDADFEDLDDEQAWPLRRPSAAVGPARKTRAGLAIPEGRH